MFEQVQASRLRLAVALLAAAWVLPIASATSPTPPAAHVEARSPHAAQTPARKGSDASVRSIRADALTAHVDESVLLRQASLSASTSGDNKLRDPRMTDFQQVPVYQEPRGLNLPEPNGWSALLATLALAGFFFIRRIK